MSNAMISEAEQKRDAMIGDATAAARSRMAELQQQIAEAERRLESVRFQVDKELETERKRLAVGQEQLRAFIREVRAVCNEELAQLELLPELPPEEPKPVIQVTPPVPAPAPAPAPEDEPEGEEEEVPAQDPPLAVSAFAPASVPKEPEDAEEDPFADEEFEDGSETRVLNLDDLQFGPNYTRD